MKSKINIEKILKTDSKNLAILIISHRILGCWKDEAKACMIELSKRKANGDTFDFESFIDEEVKKYQFKINIQDVLTTKNKVGGMISQSILGSIIGFGGKSSSTEEEDLEDDLDFED